MEKFHLGSEFKNAKILFKEIVGRDENVLVSDEQLINFYAGKRIIVIGAGAAGLMASIQAGERGLKVLLLEKGEKAGRKILISGGGRCNITNNKYEHSSL